jgi:hypothetical protein
VSYSLCGLQCIYNVACRTVTGQRPANSNRGTVFSVRSVPTCYKQENWSNELVVAQSPTGKNVSTEAEDVVGNRHKETTSVDTTD